MTAKTFEELFIEELSDIYNAEKQLTKALPKMAEAASNDMLSEGFLKHLEETQGQIARIEQLVEDEGLTLKNKKCAAMEGLIEEGKQAIDEIEAGPLLDVALIIAAQKVEHYEISGYGSLIELAKLLGYDSAVELLAQTLEEEKSTDEKLTELAVGDINEEAKTFMAQA